MNDGLLIVTVAADAFALLSEISGIFFPLIIGGVLGFFTSDLMFVAVAVCTNF